MRHPNVLWLMRKDWPWHRRLARFFLAGEPAKFNFAYFFSVLFPSQSHLWRWVFSPLATGFVPITRNRLWPTCPAWNPSKAAASSATLAPRGRSPPADQLRCPWRGQTEDTFGSRHRCCCCLAATYEPMDLPWNQGLAVHNSWIRLGSYHLGFERNGLLGRKKRWGRVRSGHRMQRVLTCIDQHGAISGSTSWIGQNSRLVVIALWGVDLVFAMDSVASKLASVARPPQHAVWWTKGLPVDSSGTVVEPTWFFSSIG